VTTSGSAQKRLCVIFNPTARGEGARRVIGRLKTVQPLCALKPTLAAGAARLLAAEAVREGFDTIVAMGGDGTVNEVLNGIGDEPDGFARVRLAVLPVGTVNVFARELGVPFQFDRAWQVICRGRETTVDLPNIQFETAHGTRQRWFAQMAGCGLDARAVELMNWELKKKIGQFAYVLSAWQALREKAPAVSVTDGSRTYEGQLVLLGNGRLYGGSIPVFHQADLRDGLLDVLVFRKVNWFVLLRYASAYLSPRLLRRGREEYFQAAAVTLTSAAAAPVEIDGEHVGHAPVSCSVRRNLLRVLVP
jgi:YegS/Rv2252/BmrU family lipid kinase